MKLTLRHKKIRVCCLQRVEKRYVHPGISCHMLQLVAFNIAGVEDEDSYHKVLARRRETYSVLRNGRLAIAPLSMLLMKFSPRLLERGGGKSGEEAS